MSSALKNGGPIVWASCLIMGLGNIAAGQFIKGLLFLAIEVLVILYMIGTEGGLYWLSMLPSLGDKADEKVWDDAQGVFVTIQGDRSQMILLYAVASIVILVALAVIWRASVRSGYLGLKTKKSGAHVPSFIDDVKALFDGNIHKLLMSLPFLFLCIFTIIPLVYMMLMAFTNYSKVDEHLLLFDWVGMKNFVDILNSGSTIGSQFWSVLGWTLIWAFFATFLNFFFGTFMAMIINRPTTRFKGLWRTVLSLTIAIPQFVSLLIIRTMFQQEGIVNTTLQDLGFLAAGETLPFMTHATWARALIIVINLGGGIP